jgi:hypothetical protein
LAAVRIADRFSWCNRFDAIAVERTTERLTYYKLLSLRTGQCRTHP